MGIIIKFMLKNIKEKKLRTFLIVFSIALSSALFFASNGLSTTLGDMIVQQMKAYFGDANIIIHANQKSPTSFVKLEPAKALGNKLEYIVGNIDLTAYYKPSRDETVNINMKGYELEDIMKMNPFNIVQQQNLEPFGGRKVIISKVFATKYHLDLGNSIVLEINGTKQRFRIGGIAASEGPLKDVGRTQPMIVPKDTLASLLDARGKSYMAYIKVAKGENVQDVINELSSIYNRYTVRETISNEEIVQQMSTITTPFMFVTCLVLFMSVFIIYTSFKVITMERLPVIGTFRSIGATRKMTDRVLLVESILYGIIGGIVGCILGIGALYAMATIFASMAEIDVSIRFTNGQLIQTFLLAVILSVVSSLIPIIKVSKLPVKDVVLNKIETKSKKKQWKLYVGIGILIEGLVLPIIVPRGLAMLVDLIFMLGIFVAIILLIPYLTEIFIRIFEKVYLLLIGNVGVLAAKNLRDNKNILNNIALLTIGISSIIMINTVSYSMNIEVVNAYNDLTYDLFLSTGNMDRTMEQKVRSIPGVSGTYAIYGGYNDIQVKDTGQMIGYVQGIDVNKQANYFDYRIDPELYKQLDTGRYIIMTNAQGKKLGVEKGDILTLEMKKGERKYTVLGFYNTLMNNGQYAMVPLKYYKSDMDVQFFDEIDIKTSIPPEEVEKALKKKFERNTPYIKTMKQQEEDNRQSNAQMMGMLQGFSFMTVIIGIFGVLNNLLISFMERKRSLAVMRSVGMSKNQTLKMLFIEAVTGGMIGGSTGVLGGFLVDYIVQYLLETIDLPMRIHYSLGLFMTSFIAGGIVMIVASMGPAIKSSKYNIIDSIKYE